MRVTALRLPSMAKGGSRRRHEAFAGRTALVTGGASGIGRALGAELAAHGARVVLADIDGDAVSAAAHELAPRTGQSRFGRWSPPRHANEAAFRSLVDEIIATRGGIDLLFNNAGITMGGPTHELTGAHWDRIVDVNIRGVVNGVLAVYPSMVEQGHGHIVNTASAAGLAPPPFVTPYAMTKQAVIGLSTALRPEAASARRPGQRPVPRLDRDADTRSPTRGGPADPLCSRDCAPVPGHRATEADPRRALRAPCSRGGRSQPGDDRRSVQRQVALVRPAPVAPAHGARQQRGRAEGPARPHPTAHLMPPVGTLTPRGVW